MNNINRLFKYCEDFNDKYVNYKLFIFEYVLYLVHDPKKCTELIK